MRLSDYLKDKWAAVMTGILCCLLTAVFLLYMETAVPVIVMTELVSAMGFLLIVGYDFVRKKVYYDELEKIWSELEEKSYLSELIEEPSFYDGKLLYQIVKQSEKYLNDVIASQQQEMMDYRDYVETWAHEIKTPIAVQKLLIENNRGPLTSSIEEETEKIEGFVEQMLYYTKSGSLETDYMIQPVNLKSLVMTAVRKNSKMMVAAGLFPKFENLDITVLADPKWMGFILGQMITNSVKYADTDSPHKKPCIAFQAQEEGSRMTAFQVADNGIGIPEKDISRVFQKGFTGENGRAGHKSTGMGLYLCKNLCDKMEIPLEVTSVCGEGTKFTFHLKKSGE